MKSQFDIKEIIILFVLIIISQRLQSQTVTDYDGNTYQTVTIGNQTWMAENVRAIHYSDGTSINDGSTFTYYPIEVAMNSSDSTKYYFYQNNDTSNAIPYGCLYNWFAAVNGNYASSSIPHLVQGVCPSGWHIPSMAEWEILKNNIGENSAEKLLLGGSSGFNAVYGGTRHDLENEFQGMEAGGSYVSTNVEPDGYITLFILHIDYDEALFGYHRKTTGYSVRCVKDTSDISNILRTESNFMIILYPNPCKDYFYINSNDIEIKRASIYSSEGKLIRSIDMQGENKTSVFDIDKGLYIVTISTDNNIYTDKLIIE